ncbi:septum site-determining protein Ssd [Rhodococcus sp. ARC_M5]|uniref:septum site-determining protein Ssd n=1 Tax=Rhodococcus sp. ARC_M5 TaxID=2928851 RepID=UPI001FB35838|nr:septum site-determining protein Ssd [Rhodococcus sp. ARC_M5]MCJ0894602.1 CpaE-like family protein [Rhodococcus sp. ARC_M5]
METDSRQRSVHPAVTMSIELRGLREDVYRIAAAADCVVEEQNLLVGISSTRSIWDRAGTVLIDFASAETALSAGYSRRAGVVLVTASTPSLDDWRTATALGAEHVISLPADEDVLVRILGEPASAPTGDGGVIAVVGARGGAGASTFAAALGLCGSRASRRVLLVEGDRYGSGLDLLLGWENTPGLRWSGLVVEGGRVSADALHGALPSRDGLSVLALGRSENRSVGLTAVAVTAVLDAGRAAGDLVVCDAPRHPSDVSDAVYDAADLVALMLPAELRAVTSAEAVAAYVADRNANVGLVVRGPAPGGLRADDIAVALELPLLASMRAEPGLAERLERGGLMLGRRSRLAAAANEVLDTFAHKPGGQGWAA